MPQMQLFRFYITSSVCLWVVLCGSLCIANARNVQGRTRDVWVNLSEDQERYNISPFWQLCGIVKGELRCNQEAGSSTSDDSQPRVQLDQLGVYILDHIRSFLKFTDVLDEAN